MKRTLIALAVMVALTSSASAVAITGKVAAKKVVTEALTAPVGVASITVSTDIVSSKDMQAATFHGDGADITGVIHATVTYEADGVSLKQSGSGTVAFAADASSITLQGNQFNGINQLIQANGSGLYPALDGSLITNLTSDDRFGFLTGSNGTMGVGTFATGYANKSVTISSVTVIILVDGEGGSTGTDWSCCNGGSCVTATSAAGAAAGTEYVGVGAVVMSPGDKFTLKMGATDETTTPTANVTCAYK